VNDGVGLGGGIRFKSGAEKRAGLNGKARPYNDFTLRGETFFVGVRLFG
jgi:hypothetical protein